MSTEKSIETGKDTGFLNLHNMKLMALKVLAGAHPHPLLAQLKADTCLRTAYVEGCVLAALIEDGEISETKREKIIRIGLSFQLSEAEIEGCFNQVKELSEDKQKEEFVDELRGLLKLDPVRQYFIKDFMAVLKVDGAITDEANENLNCIGMMLFECENWREKVVLSAEDGPSKASSQSKQKGGEVLNNVWLMKRPTNFGLTRIMKSVILETCVGQKRLEELFYRDTPAGSGRGLGVICEKVPYDVAMKIKYEIEKYGGRVDVMTCTD